MKPQASAMKPKISVRPSLADGAIAHRGSGSVGQQHSRNGTATVLRRGGEEHWRFSCAPPTEMTTGHRGVGGACRRRTSAFADADRANRQLVPTGTLTRALRPENAGRSEPMLGVQSVNDMGSFTFCGGAGAGGPNRALPPSRTRKEFLTDLDDLRNNRSRLLLRWKRL